MTSKDTILVECVKNFIDGSKLKYLTIGKKYYAVYDTSYNTDYYHVVNDYHQYGAYSKILFMTMRQIRKRKLDKLNSL